MLLQAIGASLPAAMAVALSPFPVIGVVLLLAGRRGLAGGVAFAVGWLVGLTIVATIVALAFGSADDPDSTSSTIADWGRIIAGAALIVFGIRKWLRRPRGDDEVAVPGWMASLDEMSITKAFLLGAASSGANPKNFILTAAATAAMVEAGIDDADLFAAVAVFVLLGSWTVIGAVFVHVVGGDRGAAGLDAVRRFMIANNTAIVVLIMLILGANVLGGGLEGLGR